MTEIKCGKTECVYRSSKGYCGKDLIELEETDGSDGYVNCASCILKSSIINSWIKH